MAQLKHGEDDLYQGPDNIVWGFLADIADLSTSTIVHVALQAQFPPPNNELFFVWTGDHDLPLLGNTYKGVKSALMVDGMPASTSNDDLRVRCTIRGIPKAEWPAMAEPPGVIECTLRFVYSEDGGTTYNVIPRSVVGFMSNAQLVRDQYTFELATDISDVDRGRPILWSHDYQQVRYPGDTGFRHLAEMSDGVGDIQWPPLT